MGDPARGVDAAALKATEDWFVAHGLPYFVDHIRAEVHRGLARRRLVRVTLVAVALATAVIVGLALTERLEWDDGLVPGINVALLSVVLYGLFTLRAWVIATWAARRTFSSLGLLFPLVTRALPLLLLFITFLFINAEVWEVSSRLDGRVMWLTVALFLTITVGFLLARLPEELTGFDDHVDSDELGRHLEGTPLSGFRQQSDQDVSEDVAIAGLQKANLLLMLLITQLVQVVLLSLAVFAFFIVFGLLIMDPLVVEGWTGQPTTSLNFSERANLELVQVSTFLAAFSGLYFTVYAVTDEVYRTQFFSSIVRELERAVSVRATYRALRRTQH